MSDSIRRIVFLGTPAYAAASLEALYQAGYEIVLVISQPDRPAGRGMRLTPPPTKVLAQSYGIEVRQTERISRDRELIDYIIQLRPDLMVTAAYGQILSQEIIDIAPHGIWNIHASLLPAWRGAAPIQASILAGEQETGITIMRTERGIDTGDILTQRAISISDEDTTVSMTERLAILGAELLLETIRDIDSISAYPQDHAQATHAPKVTRDMYPIDWASESAVQIVRGLRALGYRQCRLTDDYLLKVMSATARPGQNALDVGYIIGMTDAGIEIATIDGILIIESVRPPGKGTMSASDWIRGFGDMPERLS